MRKNLSKFPSKTGTTLTRAQFKKIHNLQKSKTVP